MPLVIYIHCPRCGSKRYDETAEHFGRTTIVTYICRECGKRWTRGVK